MPDIKPQHGPQERFLASSADIVVFGGAAGGGKTFALTMESLRHVDVPGFGAIVFRRTNPQLVGSGSIWQEAQGLYRAKGGTPREMPRMEWRFPAGTIIEFSHLQYKRDIGNHLSKGYALILFDQLEQFTGDQFWALFGRNRSVCGVSPYVRAACNPDPDCFLYANGAGLITWWIGDDGYPIKERSGVIRWFVREPDDSLVWGDSAMDVRKKAPHICEENPDAPISITFIGAKLEDNKALTDADPKYKAKLLALPRVERERKLLGNWKVKPSAGMYFQRSWFEVIDAVPMDVSGRVRAWDMAATKPSPSNPDPDWTVGVRYARLRDGTFCIEHVERLRESPLGVERAVVNTATSDGRKVRIGLWQDPGGAGKAQLDHFRRLLSGYTTRTERATKDKVTYAGPVSSQAEAGNIKVVRGPWLETFMYVLEGFPDGGHDDDVDALSLAHLLSSNSDLDMLRRLATR